MLGPAMVAAGRRWSGEELPSQLAAAEENERENGKAYGMAAGLKRRGEDDATSAFVKLTARARALYL